MKIDEIAELVVNELVELGAGVYMPLDFECGEQDEDGNYLEVDYESVDARVTIQFKEVVKRHLTAHILTDGEIAEGLVEEHGVDRNYFMNKSQKTDWNTYLDVTGKEKSDLIVNLTAAISKIRKEGKK